MIQQRAELIDSLRASQQQVVDVLLTVSDVQDWQPHEAEWSFREIAAHMAAVEEECFEVRVHRIVQEDVPRFEYYLNTGRDFGGASLSDSVEQWQSTRNRLLSYVGSLSESELLRTGLHATFGEINVLGALQIMADHDAEHLADLESQVHQHKISGRRADQ